MFRITKHQQRNNKKNTEGFELLKNKSTIDMSVAKKFNDQIKAI